MKEPAKFTTSGGFFPQVSYTGGSQKQTGIQSGIVSFYRVNRNVSIISFSSTIFVENAILLFSLAFLNLLKMESAPFPQTN
ncbi:hypothetical protein HMPREF1210_00879 [Paenisporosarcina sp. HGH0030]|nr:hypothetical protein HMPREF1210_00879 [Paenisporosarcina sp. HGH0030]